MRDRKHFGDSHSGRYSYWFDRRDLYVYQFDEATRTWIGWLCGLPAWERTFSRADWITLAAEVL